MTFVLTPQDIEMLAFGFGSGRTTDSLDFENSELTPEEIEMFAQERIDSFVLFGAFREDFLRDPRFKTQLRNEYLGRGTQRIERSLQNLEDSTRRISERLSSIEENMKKIRESQSKINTRLTDLEDKF
jgi:predicted nuclease with TOPRIM domain